MWLSEMSAMKAASLIEILIVEDLCIDARGLQCGDVQKYVRAAGVVSDETVTAFGIPHFQFSGRHRVLFPLRLQPGVASRHRRACSLQPFGRHRLRQRELDYPATAAEPVAQREAPAAMSHSDNSFMQSHFFTFSPSFTSWRMGLGAARLVRLRPGRRLLLWATSS